MADDTNPQWTRHFDGIADELLRLAIACDVKLVEPGVIERILKNDTSVCGRHNELGFEKLHKLLMMTYDSLGKSVDRIGASETKHILETIRHRLEALPSRR